MSGWHKQNCFPQAIFPVAAFFRRVGVVVVAVVLLSLLSPAISHAGGGPENVFLVVNANSQASCSVANHYIALRKIPLFNVLYLNWDRSLDRISVDDFRKYLLNPIHREINKRQIADQIDYIVYSSDFPWSIDLKADFASHKLSKQFAPVGSLTGVTYLSEFVRTRSTRVISLDNNFYFRRPDPVEKTTTSHGFKSWYGWSAEGKLLEAGGQHYRLSTMLAVTKARGSTVDQAVSYLTRAANADQSHPAGTIYYMQNNDIRAKTRASFFEPAVRELEKLGVGATIEKSVLPENKSDVAGLMAGVANFKWYRSKSKIVPGAICEHLTSFGGSFRENESQTPLTDFLNHGAAGSSGTVIEPYAIQAKFPLATIHVHYARGCSLAESYYQAVRGPYQLLIVGDPLCAPWAVIPEVYLAGFDKQKPLHGEVRLEPRCSKVRPGAKIARYELFVDGRKYGQILPEEVFRLDTSKLSDGYHELRIVATDSSAIETQGRTIAPVQVSNHGLRVALGASQSVGLRASDDVLLTATCPTAKKFTIVQGSRILGTLDANAQGRAEMNVSLKKLGRGPIRIQAVAHLSPPVASAPLVIEVE